MVAGWLSEGVCVEAPCWTAPTELGVGVAPEQSGNFQRQGFSQKCGDGRFISRFLAAGSLPICPCKALWRSGLFVAHKATMVALKASCSKGIGWV